MGHYTSKYPRGIHYTYALYYPNDYPDSHKAGTVFYIGKGIGNRIDQHEEDAQRGDKSYKSNVIRKIWANGGQVIKKVLACFKTHEEAIQYEIALIFFMDGLTNKTHGGEGVVGLVVSEATRRKSSESHKASLRNKEATKKRAEKRRGTKASEETRRKMSETRKGKKLHITAETRRKKQEVQINRRGIKQSPESIAKRVAANTGKKRTEETRQRISESLKTSPRLKEHHHRMSERQKGRPIVQWQTEEIKGRRSASLKTSPLAQDQRRKLHEANRGRTVSIETRQKLSERIVSEETRQKLSEAAKRQWSKET